MNKNLVLRIVSAAIALPVVLWLILLGGTPMAGFLVFASVVLFREYGNIVANDDAFARHLLVVVGTLVVIGGMAVTEPLLAFTLVQGGAMLIALIYTLRPGDMTTVWPRMAGLAFGLVYIGLGNIAVFRLRVLGGETLGADATPGAWLFIVMAATWANDTFAYFAGRAFGKHKLYEKVSPKKTWEGAVGGALGSVLGPLGLVLALPVLFGPITVVDVLFIGVPAAIIAPLGDLCESLLKRCYDVKDSGGILPGHGGLLDRVDAMYFVLPWAMAYVVAIRPFVTG